MTDESNDWIVLQTNNACESLDFIIETRALLRKIIARFFHFIVSLIGPLKQLFGLLWLNIAQNLHCWTLNHQHTYIKWELKKISQLYRPVLMMTGNNRFVAVCSICYSTKWKIMQKYLGVKSFNIQLVQELIPNGLPQRRIFGKWALGKLANSLSKKCIQKKS